MAVSQRILWTLLPNGVKDSSTLRATVSISPRLSLAAGDQPNNLSRFADWLKWPETILGTTFGVSVDGGGAIPAKRALYKNLQPDQETWAALFPPDTFVRPYDFDAQDLSGKVIVSYPVASVAKTVRQAYAALAATTANELPTLRQLELFRPLAVEMDNFDKATAQLRDSGIFDVFRPQNGPNIRGPIQIDRNDPATALRLQALYHRPLEQEIVGQYVKTGRDDIHENVSWRAYNRVTLPSSKDLKDKIDFHRTVSSLGQYSDLLRLTGLVVDLEFPRSFADGDHVLQLVVNWPQHGGIQTDPDVRPRIQTSLRDTSFAATPEDPATTQITDRFLRLRSLTPPTVGARPVYFDVLDMDVDGGGIKYKNFLLTWPGATATVYDDETDDSLVPASFSAPSLRSGGITLAYSDRANAAAKLFDRSKKLQDLLTSGDFDNDADGILRAEDIVRGYRADIYDYTRQSWFTLFKRDGTYSFLNTGGSYSSNAEEGMIRMGAVSSADGTNPDILKIHEGIFSWRGWSLAAPEPGNSLKAAIDPKADGSDAANVVGPGTADVPDGLPLETSFTATEATLPSLRFGREYAMRVRLVDLAGESAPFSAADAQPPEASTNKITYRRYEPIEAPALALVKGTGGIEEPAEGESMGRIAIRTFNDVPAKNTQPIPDRARRHIVPPRVTHRFAETHGVMDKNGRVDPDLFLKISGLDDSLDTAIVQAAGTAPVQTVAGARQCLEQLGYDPGKAPGNTVDSKFTSALKAFQKDNDLASRPAKVTDAPTLAALSAACGVTYAVADENFTLPYLPDPWAIGAVIKIQGLDGIDPAKLYPVPFYDTGFAYTNTKKPPWPNAKPFTIVIAETGAADAVFDAATREFRVPLAKAERARVRISSLMPITPILNMAVWQMMVEAGMDQAALAAVGLEIAKGQHWMFTPWRIIELVHAVQKPLITPKLSPVLTDRDRGWLYAVPVFLTPLHAKSTAKIDLLARWSEPDDDPGVADIRNHAAHVFEIKLSRQATPKNLLGVGGPRNKPGEKDIRPRHIFGDTRYRRVFYKVDATTRYREYMPLAIQSNNENIKVTSPEQRTWVQNAAPPPAPKILYVVPTFGWSRSANGGEKRSLRSGGGLRVYLDRPWFATGFTEMLAVVLPPGPVFHNWAAYGEAQILPPFVTQWGADPIWVGGRVQTVAPPPTAFPLAKWKAPITFDGATKFPADEGSDLPPGDFKVTELRTPDMADDPTLTQGPGPLTIAPHAVAFDAERGLWYADIVVRPGDVYFPFIRLALARYNPVSVEGAHLSSAVMAEFVQLTPDRLAIITQNGGVAQVAVHGVGTSQGQGASQQAQVFDLTIEVLDPGADPDLGWRRVEAVRRAPPSTGGNTGVLRLPRTLSPTLPKNLAPNFTLQVPGAALQLPTDLATQGQELIDSGNFNAFLKRPDLILALQPPLLWQGGLGLPSVAPGTRMRLVITESESFQTAEPGEADQITGARVVYVETVEVTPPIEAPAPVQPPPPPVEEAPPVEEPPADNSQQPEPPQRSGAIPNYAGRWLANAGPAGMFNMVLQQNGTQVTGTYEPVAGGGVTATLTGSVDATGTLAFTWVLLSARKVQIGTGGSKVLLSLDGAQFDGRWWFGPQDNNDPTTTWHGDRQGLPPATNTLKFRPLLQIKPQLR